MSRVRRFLGRLVCRREGHDTAMTTLPEDGWGLYAYSRIWCKRCGWSEAPYIWADLARYNAERSRGIEHSPEFAHRMALQQEYWTEIQAAGFEVREPA